MAEKNNISGKKKSGGNRAGAGRKAKGDIRNITLSLRIDSKTSDLISKAAEKQNISKAAEEQNISRADIVIKLINENLK